jgi:glucose-6-phosphate isomerase
LAVPAKGGLTLTGRILSRDATVFASPGTEAWASVTTRLGWVDAPTAMASRVADVEAFAAGALQSGLTDLYLLGMGGSSLCAEVLRDVPMARRPGGNLTVLDTTDERAVQAVTTNLVPERSLFIVASKSGATIEVSSLERHFWSVMSAALPTSAGRHFVAITDPDTALAARAGRLGYRQTFLNPADIGGRFSALSLFGLVPAALMGLDVRALLASGEKIAEQCRTEGDNPGLALGTFMGKQAASGRDKLTLLLPPALEPLGVWIEQLVAESTGKNNRGVLPVVGEPAGLATEYGRDRAFVIVTSADGTDAAATGNSLEAAGHPVFRIKTTAAALGGEFLRWEVATAVAGAVLGVNPFDEPNVKDAKERTQRQLDTFTARGMFHFAPPLAKVGGRGRREYRGAAPAGGRYVAILDYVSADATRGATIDRGRRELRQRTGLASTYGVGPRYLHSTGQYHKGGPNTGMFLLITATDATTTPVPGEPYSFRTLKEAQALGDFEALVAAGRTVIHYHLDDPAADFDAAIDAALKEIR